MSVLVVKAWYIYLFNPHNKEIGNFIIPILWKKQQRPKEIEEQVKVLNGTARKQSSSTHSGQSFQNVSGLFK